MKLFQEETDMPQARSFRYKGYYTLHTAQQGYSSTNSTDCNIESSKISGHISEISQCLSELSNICWITFNDQPPTTNPNVNSTLTIDIHDFNPNLNVQKTIKKRLYSRGETKFHSYSTRAIKLNKGAFKKGCCTSGRWSEAEHRRFVEAIIKFGNDWKNVQSHIKTRSSAQSRSHSQKFFMKLKNYDLLDLKDINPSIASLYELAKNLSEKERQDLIDMLTSCEYSDSQLDTQPLLQRKRKGEISSNDDFKQYAIPMHLDETNSKNKLAVAMLPSEVQTLSIESSKPMLVVAESDDFHSNFFSAFQRGRRISFEENLHTFYFYLCQENTQNNSINQSDDVEDKITHPHIEYAI